jgi:cephalosporin hydroxylase
MGATLAEPSDQDPRLVPPRVQDPQAVAQHRPKVCVELGTWQGASAVPVARMIARWGGTLTCVDTWSGQLDENGGSLPTSAGDAPGLRSRDGRSGVGANVRLIPATTARCGAVWSEPIDFLYIDADHSYEGVLADLEAWVPHVRPVA